MGKFAFTVCTPIPVFIPREIALQVLHDHSQVINTNPLVLEHKPITAPKVASYDELRSAWYEIVERIQYVPGLGKMGSGKISFPGCFHDMPWGLQTHIHAPLGIDMRVQYKIAGEVAGVELTEPREIGLASLGAPEEGLYLRTDAEVKCNAMMSSFVKSQTKDATNAMVAQIVQNAERMDADILRRMITEERLARNATIRAGRDGRNELANPTDIPPLPEQGHMRSVTLSDNPMSPISHEQDDPRSVTLTDNAMPPVSSGQGKHRSVTLTDNPVPLGLDRPKRVTLTDSAVFSEHGEYPSSPDYNTTTYSASAYTQDSESSGQRWI